MSLIVRLDEHRHEILRFMKEPAIPFDNNMAERDLGMVKVRQKISGTFRNMSRVDDYCSRIRSFISTLKKQGRNVFTAMTEIFMSNYEKRWLLDS